MNFAASASTPKRSNLSMSWMMELFKLHDDKIDKNTEATTTVKNLHENSGISDAPKQSSPKVTTIIKNPYEHKRNCKGSKSMCPCNNGRKVTQIRKHELKGETACVNERALGMSVKCVMTGKHSSTSDIKTMSEVQKFEKVSSTFFMGKHKFEIIDVPPDGNCGYHAAWKFVEQTGRTKTELSIDTIKKNYNYAAQNNNLFKLEQHELEEIYNPNHQHKGVIGYHKGCNFSGWLRDETFLIIAMRCDCSVLVLHAENLPFFTLYHEDVKGRKKSPCGECYTN